MKSTFVPAGRIALAAQSHLPHAEAPYFPNFDRRLWWETEPTVNWKGLDLANCDRGKQLYYFPVKQSNAKEVDHWCQRPETQSSVDSEYA